MNQGKRLAVMTLAPGASPLASAAGTSTPDVVAYLAATMRVILGDAAMQLRECPAVKQTSVRYDNLGDGLPVAWP